MCGQFEALLYLNFLKNTLGMTHLPDEPDAGPDPVAPSVGAPIVVQNPETWELEIIPARFGLIPHWHRGAIKDWKGTSFNARLDTVATKPTFRGPWMYRHALVPAHCFYEWSGPKGAREKWRIARNDNQPLAFAGLWDCASLIEGDIWSFAILTRDAGRDMAAIHDREPVVLHPEQWEAWLRNRPADLTQTAPLKVMAG